MTSPSNCIRRIISSGDALCAVSENPWMTPMSWIGKNPFGMLTSITPVIAMVMKNTPSVIHFLGKENPIALRKAEVNKMLGKMDEMAEAGGMSMSEPFIIGETIKIIEGPFNDFNGIIEEVNDEKKKLKVTVKIFGRSTPVELNYMQVEKIA